MTYTQEARRHYGIAEWELTGPAEWRAELEDGVTITVVQLDEWHPQGEHSASVQWHSEDASDAGVYRTLREAQRAAYDMVTTDFAEYLQAYDRQGE